MRQSGFTIIELVIVIAIIGIISAVSFGGGLFRPKPLDAFVSNLSSLTASARIGAILGNSLHRVYFDFNRNEISIQKEESASKKASQKFVPVAIIPNGTKSSMLIDPALKITQLLIEGRDELTGKKNAWFFISAQGTAQKIQLSVENIETRQRKTLDINPFIAYFAEHDDTEKNN
jgi:prepilin-type N-terminal cleavage/methylation domain-containing protein